MGVAATAAVVILMLAVGAAVTRRLEWRLVGSRGEAGPASRVGVAKRDVLPTNLDPWMYYSAPVVALLGAGWAAVVIPFGPRWIGADLTIGLFYFLVVVDYVVLGVALGGWGAVAPHSVESCYRIVAQLIAYVIPLGLAVIGPIMMARSLSTVDIVEAQVSSGLWYVVVQPLGFVLYVATALMQSYRAPFLEPFAERLNLGVLTVYGGWKLVVWRLALAGLLFVVSAMGAVLFLGGYGGPYLPAPLWMAIKTLGLMTLMIWLGRCVRLLTTAEMLALAWKILIPAGLLNVLIVGVLILLGVGQSPFN